MENLTEEQNEKLYDYLIAFYDCDLEDEDWDSGGMDLEELINQYPSEAKEWIKSNHGIQS